MRHGRIVDTHKKHPPPSHAWTYPGKHVHRPVCRLHMPLLEHSARGCRSLALTTLPTHAVSYGHARNEQSGPVHSASPRNVV